MNKQEKLRQLYTKVYTEVQNILLYQPDDFRIEQIEYNNDDHFNSVVVSFLIKRNLTSREDKFGLAYLAANHVERVYKEIKFKENEEIKGVYIYEK
jgi:hypothetical protein